VGGLEHVVFRLSTAMAARGHEVTVFTSNLSRNGHVAPHAEDIQGVSVRRFPTWFRLGTFASFWPEFCGELKTRSFDVIHAHSYRHPHCELAAWLRARDKTKFILDPHWPAYPRGRWGGALAKAYDAALGKRLLGGADLVLCATPLEVPWLRTMGARTIRVVPHGIPATYLGEPNGHAPWRGRGVDEFLVVSVGRIEESKGFQFVIDALRKVDGVRYLIAGPRGPFYPQLVKMIEAHHLEHRVILLGEVSEQEKLNAIDAADAFIQPSLFEAYGISTLEALARGRPCLASKVGGLPWLLSGCGLVFEVGNTEEIARCLRQLRDDAGLRKTLGETGRQKASRLTWDQIVPEYERMLLELVRS
jgi:glycosyltransferase involved in cell wall biosynthesis